jgi:hypothetical protein
VAVSALMSVIVARFTRPTNPELVEKYFGKLGT